MVSSLQNDDRRNIIFRANAGDGGGGGGVIDRSTAIPLSVQYGGWLGRIVVASFFFVLLCRLSLVSLFLPMFVERTKEC